MDTEAVEKQSRRVIVGRASIYDTLCLAATVAAAVLTKDAWPPAYGLA